MAAIVLQRVPSLRRPPTSVRMTAIDSKGYTLEYKLVTDLLRNPKGTKHDLRVPFIPPVKAASDVRARLVDMSIEAVDKLPRSVRTARCTEDRQLSFLRTDNFSATTLWLRCPHAVPDHVLGAPRSVRFRPHLWPALWRRRAWSVNKCWRQGRSSRAGQLC